MKNKYSQLLLGTLGILITFGLILFIVNLIPSKISEEDRSGIRLSFPKISENQFIKSEFVASNNNLNRVDILFKNPNLESRDELLISIKKGNSVIIEKHFSGFNFGDTSHARLDFAPIANSKNESYTIEVITTKIIDGKLAVGMRDKKLDNVIYYQSKFSVNNALSNTFNIFEKFIFKQVGVLVLPVMLLGILIW